MKNNNNLICGVMLILLSLFSQNSFSLTHVAGIISQDTTWSLSGSPYRVLQSLIVNEGVTLNIEPGVRVEFYKQTSGVVNENLNIIMGGQIIAIGTAENPIVFTSSSSTPQPGDWAYIEFTPTAMGASYNSTGEYLSGSILKYVTVEYGGGDKEYPTLYANGIAPYLNNAIIKNNADTGIKYNAIKNEIFIENSSFSNNSTSSDGGFGGAIYSNETSLTINGSSFTSNSATSGLDFGGAIYSYSSPYLNSSPQHLIVNNSAFNNNYATSHGGAIYTNSLLTVNNSSFNSNFVYSFDSINNGGAIFADSLTVNNSTFTGNSAFDSGGAIYSYADLLIVNNSTFTNNNNFFDGGAIYARVSMDVKDSTFEGNYSYNNGGILYSEENITIQNTSLTNNYSGSAVYAKNSAIIKNSTITNNKVAPDVEGLSEPDSSESCGVDVQGELTISDSNIYGNGNYDIRNNSASNVQASNNYWGTNDEALIFVNIYDVYEDPDVGEVLFHPYLDSVSKYAPFLDETSPTVTDLNRPYDMVQKAYLAYYGRPSEVTGLEYWSSYIHAFGGVWTTEMLDKFGNSEEFQSEFGTLTTTQLVSNIYQRLFNRSPDQAGRDYFVNLIGTGKSSLSEVAVQILNGAKGDDAITVGNKLLVSKYFTQKVSGGMGYGPTQDIKEIISKVSKDSTIVLEAYALIDAMAGI